MVFLGVERYFVFRLLPFGLLSACYLFTRMFKPFVARWRSFGTFAIINIDDGIFACRALSFNLVQNAVPKGLKN